ncbi:DNA cytosine methyltransferase [Brevibacterium luteolum]|uniref:DNA cytosine methyltransferase n=1 Tax=Brevibacterium luteolum TaxID=199591 RepID=UPI00223B2C3D|nr:DNA cytosine methyltransferase [Brevibacterium luteolum]MCT1874273.1 DNA cytosine methyltransferase [Brevibacterium luteolum]MCT1891468.1 DNA cytosine methyltransferase [Brevibacterium luteolum]MCT1894129.1 DNA cytosine methyltransferase [Brevibacterium luteolum]MCT1924978.1 DNA cytosine methyltransferase [Brevibacterium luteolum]
MKSATSLSVLEICAGAGGQSYGLERAGFNHELAVEIDQDAAATLKANRPGWDVLADDVREVNGRDYRGISLLAGGVPCPPFSLAGKQLGAEDERDLFPEAIRLVQEAKPEAVMLENVRGLASARFNTYRSSILEALDKAGYDADWQLLYSSEYQVPQLRPRFILVALKRPHFRNFEWPKPVGTPPTVGEALGSMMGSRGWAGAAAWAERANGIAPTLVGGSRKHGGADLGPTRAKKAWLELGVDGRGIADEAPGPELPEDYIPRLTNPMAARIQGLAADWEFSGRKTSVYRQIGNAFPPPVAQAIGESIAVALGASTGAEKESERVLRAVS